MEGGKLRERIMIKKWVWARERKRDRQTHRQTDRQTDIQTDRRTDRQIVSRGRFEGPGSLCRERGEALGKNEWRDMGPSRIFPSFPAFFLHLFWFRV